MVNFSKFTHKKRDKYEKFEEFISKLVWRETLFQYCLKRNFVPILPSMFSTSNQRVSVYVQTAFWGGVIKLIAESRLTFEGSVYV